MTLIDVENLKKGLELEGISTDMSDEDLGLLLTNVVKELMGNTNAPINPTNHKVILKNFCDDILELDYYPVRKINSFVIGSKTLTDEDYVLDEELGILYLHSNMSGLLVIEYCCQLSDDMISNIVNPLVFDIIKYRLTTNFSNNGDISSMKEGDVSVNYNTNSSLGNLIQSRIKDLKNCYSIRIKVL